MFSPHFTISHKLLGNIKHIASLVTELNRQRFTKVALVHFERNARVVSAFSSTSIEGNPLPLTEVKKILKQRPHYLRDSEREVINYNEVLISLDRLLKKQPVAFSIKLILDIQKQVTHGLLSASQSGKLRKAPVFVNDPRTRKSIYLPPDHQEVPQLMDELIEFVNKNKDRIDPLILAGLFHKQFVIVHPFIDGNGRTARLATKILLAGMGLNTFNLFSFENYYNQNVTQYFRKVGVLGNYYDIKESLDFTEWLEYFTDGIIDELLRVSKELVATIPTPNTSLKTYHQKIIDYIKENGYITDKLYAMLTKRARPTRHLDLRRLIALGLIEQKEQGKATYYTLKN